MGRTSLLFEQEEVSWKPPEPRRPGFEIVLLNLSTPEARFVVSRLDERPLNQLFIVDSFE